MNPKEKISQKILSLLNDYRESELIYYESNIDTESELYGREGILNSFNLVTLIVDLEEYVEDEFGQTVTIADEKVFSMKHSPFRTVEALAAYTAGLLQQE